MTKFGSKKSGKADFQSQVQQLQEQLMQTQQALADETVEASAGGGAVVVEMSGTQICRSVRLSPELVAEGDVEMLQDLLLLALNQAIHDSQALAARRLGPLAGGLDALGGGA